MATVNLSAQKRDDLGNSTTKTARKKGFIPGVFYFKDAPSIAISVKDTALNPFVYTSEVRIINLQIEGSDKAQNCILKDIQFDPVSDKPIHFDLLGISENETIKVEVPIKLVGAPIGVRDGGVIQHVLHSLEVECLPANIPAHIDVEIASMAIGDAIHIGDLKIENVEIHGNPTSTIVAVVPPAVEKVEGAAAEGEAATAEPEVIAKGKKDEEEGEKK
ncbi:MAG TPA: 50S ribosomal protein L25 [Ignavibacteria bacterium]|nr:50S ribosomal protein L25 [Ignavibacteria bacterium]HAX47834.1 50S ribosomal protein L25 [Bacteroidota bacterium]HRF64452.1 50S ribosomal protein L25 [Ignavibacteria bacterium]HRJ04928.1 50S ribosomal protein L25 [Ignavibacteria bacterium]HRJ86798.1 50S ribosomal protein L25 [Ignavibacteria bacterium]